MSHPIRKWLKDLLQYGRRSVQSPGDRKSPLLWAADLPRLGQMWLGHVWYRTWFDLRQMPPRVVYHPQEVFSRDVQLIRPTTLNPIRPLERTRDAFAAFLAWLHDGGLERAIAGFGRGLAGGVVGTLGVIVLGLFGLVGTLLTGLVGLFGASALGTALGVNALGRSLHSLGGATQTGLLGVRDGLAGLFAGFVGRFRSPQEALWTMATVTGTVGLILLMVLQAGGLPGTANRATAADPHVAHRPPMQLAQAEPVDDPFGGLPDPFAPADPAPAQPEPPADDFEDPFGQAPVELTEDALAGAELEVDVARTQLPPDVARYNLPDDAEEFLVESSAPLPDLTSFPDDAWMLSLSRNEIDRQPVVPAAYRESNVTPPSEAPLPQPSPSGDRFTPATRHIGVTIRKTQPESVPSGEMLWYDLIVTNHGDEPVAGLVVEERVAEPHRVADAHPPASYASGLLTWRLDGLDPREERRLSVAVYPMSADEISTAAAVRPIATFSAVTLVQAEEPVIEAPPVDEPYIEEPPADEPLVEERPAEVPPAVAPFRRVKIAMTTPEWVREGSGCIIRFDVTNTGTAPLTGVVVRSLLPETLQHPHGRSIESAFESLAPGEQKQAELHVKGLKIGEAEMIAEVSAAEGVATTVRGSFGVIEPLPELSANDDFQPTAKRR